MKILEVVRVTDGSARSSGTTDLAEIHLRKQARQDSILSSAKITQTYLLSSTFTVHDLQ